MTEDFKFSWEVLNACVACPKEEVDVEAAEEEVVVAAAVVVEGMAGERVGVDWGKVVKFESLGF